VNELAPMLAAETPEHGGGVSVSSVLCAATAWPRRRLENAIWDLEAQREGISLAQLIGGVRDVIPCGVSLGIQRRFRN